VFNIIQEKHHHEAPVCLTSRRVQEIALTSPSDHRRGA
jgi:hypothetical protein